MDQQDKVALAHKVLQSAWWPGFESLLAERQARLSAQLEVGSEPRLEDRMRGSIAAMKWVRTFLTAELRALDKNTRPVVQ